MSLDFKDFSFLEGVHHHLNATWLIWLIDSREKSPAIVHHLNLVEVDALLKSSNFLPVFDLVDWLVLTCGKHWWWAFVTVWLKHFKTGEIDIGHGKAPDWVLLVFFGIEGPHVDCGVKSWWDKSCVICEPSNWSNRTSMGLKGHTRRVLGCVEIVHIDEVDRHAGKEMTAVWEDDLVTWFDWQILVLLNRVSKYIHHSHSVVEANDNLESSWMESHTHGIFLELLINLQFETHAWAIWPNFDSFVWGASHN